MSDIINIYCDESCHIEHDGNDIMTLAAVYCEKIYLHTISENIKEIKIKHKIPSRAEIKWNKISPCNENYFRELIEWFFLYEHIFIRGYIVRGKDKLDHERFGQDYNTWYYKIYYRLLEHVINPDYINNIYIDIKDTIGSDKVAQLRKIMNGKKNESVQRIQIVRSEEVLLVQLADIFAGALSYANRGYTSSVGPKSRICNLIEVLAKNQLTEKTPLATTKANWFVWNRG